MCIPNLWILWICGFKHCVRVSAVPQFVDLWICGFFSVDFCGFLADAFVDFLEVVKMY